MALESSREKSASCPSELLKSPFPARCEFSIEDSWKNRAFSAFPDLCGPFSPVSQRWRGGGKGVWSFIPFASSPNERAGENFASLVIDKAFLEEMSITTLSVWELLRWNRLENGKYYSGMNDKTVVFYWNMHLAVAFIYLFIYNELTALGNGKSKIKS